MKHTFILFGRSIKHILRSPDTIITVLIMPAVIMLMFVYVLGGAVKNSIGENVNYVNYQLPGILLMTVACGISYCAVRLFTDIQKGIFSRFHSMPISRAAVLWSNVLSSIVSNFISLVIIILIALLMGFRSSASILAWLGVFGILLLFTLALTWLAVISGLLAKSAEGSYIFSYPLIFLPFFSSAFVPTETMPPALRAFAENQPVTSIVNTLRYLLNSEPVGKEIWAALAWCFGIAVAGYVVALWAYKEKQPLFI
ncbi:MAG: ABC transporter permease [Lachnospiraceae bacterium]|jgi:ABC-2 type transport system permease protein|nr:ABC transporter permease [Lachnospiraceae bacterium]